MEVIQTYLYAFMHVVGAQLYAFRRSYTSFYTRKNVKVFRHWPANNHLHNVNNRKVRTLRNMFIVNNYDIRKPYIHVVLVSLLLTLSKFHTSFLLLIISTLSLLKLWASNCSLSGVSRGKKYRYIHARNHSENAFKKFCELKFTMN